MLLSFKADVFERVKSGEKIYEHRRVFPDEPVKAYLYISTPVKAIVGIMRLDNMGVDKFNHEGYFDPTTYEALTNIHREEMAADKKAAYLPLVYVCSPYAGDVETNVKNAKRYSRFAVDENAIPVTPHLLYPQFI